MVNTNSTLKGKEIIILGGSSGLGLATAQAAASEGALVTIVSSNQPRIDEALKTLSSCCNGFAVDLGKEENIKSFFESLGSFDHLVFTAGENISLGDIDKTEIDDARQFFNLRYWGAVTAVKYGAKKINPGGSINLVSGTASIRPGKGWTVASAICGAVEGFVRAAAVELAPIRVNSVVPGVTKTNLWSSLSATDRESLYNSGKNLPVKRVGAPEDVALAFIYLMKQQFGTGQNIVVDGGSVLV